MGVTSISRLALARHRWTEFRRPRRPRHPQENSHAGESCWTYVRPLQAVLVQEVLSERRVGVLEGGWAIRLVDEVSEGGCMRVSRLVLTSHPPSLVP